MEETSIKIAQRKDPYKRIIVVLSIVIPLTIAVLFRVKLPGYDFSFLPPIYATINGITAVFLISAVLAIKNGKRRLNEFFMNTCLVLSSAFFMMYVLYIMTS
jgi:putative membrane protein